MAQNVILGANRSETTGFDDSKTECRQSGTCKLFVSPGNIKTFYNYFQESNFINESVMYTIVVVRKANW